MSGNNLEMPAKIVCCHSQLEEENAQLREEVAKLREENYQLREMLRNQRLPNEIAPSVTIRIDDYLLLESLRCLTRWELDYIPLVNEQFRATALNNGAALQQRRMLDELNWHPQAYLATHPGVFAYRITIPSELVASHPRVFQSIRMAQIAFEHESGNFNRDVRIIYALDDSQMSELIRQSPLLRARCTVVWKYESVSDNAKLPGLASLWEGCNVKLWLKNPSEASIELQLTKLLPGCSALHIFPDRNIYRMPSNIHCTDIPLSNVEGEACFRSFHCWYPCHGITMEWITAFLFASVRDGQRRELSLQLGSFAEKEAPGFTSMRLKQLIEQCPPIFQLELEFKDGDPMLGEYELVPKQQLSDGSALIRIGVNYPQRCTFIAKAKKFGYNGVPTTHVQVKCD